MATAAGRDAAQRPTERLMPLSADSLSADSLAAAQQVQRLDVS